MIPGSNILRTALRVITAQKFWYYAFLVRTENSIGYDVATYKNPIQLSGSVQAVPRTLYQEYGLDLQKNYINVYVSQDITDIARDVSGDQIGFAGIRYQCLSKTPWLAMDGWDAILCVQINPQPPGTPC